MMSGARRSAAGMRRPGIERALRADTDDRGAELVALSRARPAEQGLVQGERIDRADAGGIFHQLGASVWGQPPQGSPD
jgi:hypothetical protein